MSISKKERALLLILSFLILLGVGLLYFLLKTNNGLIAVVDLVINHLIQAETKSIGQISGTLSSTIILDNVELKNVKGLPPGTLRIQNLLIKLHGLNYENADIGLNNARFMLTYSDNIVVNGTFQDGVISFTVFSSSIDVEEILRLAGIKNLNLKGEIKKIDMQVNGTAEKLKIQGSFDGEKLARKDFILHQSPGALTLDISGMNKEPHLQGTIEIDKGSLQSRKTAITLKRSTVYFSGDPKNPALSLEGFSKIGNVEIDISVKGTMEKPELKLTSDPPLSENILMVMLATGKEWPGLEKLEQGKISADIVKDFVSYLFFSGSGEGFLSKWGITDVQLTVENGKKGLGFKKEVTHNLDLGYGIQEQTTVGVNQPFISQTLGADYKVSNKFYASFERQMPTTGTSASNDPDHTIDNRFLLKYKKKF